MDSRDTHSQDLNLYYYQQPICVNPVSDITYKVQVCVAGADQYQPAICDPQTWGEEPLVIVPRKVWVLCNAGCSADVSEMRWPGNKCILNVPMEGVG